MNPFEGSFTKNINENLVPDFSGQWNRTQIIEHLKVRESLSLIVNGKLAAIILYYKINNLIEICYLCTIPEFRRQGFMMTLWEELICQNQGCHFWIDVHEDNQSARKLYAKLGFVSSGLRKGYYRDGGDAILLEKASRL